MYYKYILKKLFIYFLKNINFFILFKYFEKNKRKRYKLTLVKYIVYKGGKRDI